MVTRPEIKGILPKFALEPAVERITELFQEHNPANHDAALIPLVS